MDDNIQVRIENSPFDRDKVSKAIINTNERERQMYLARKTAIQTKEQRIDLLEQKVFQLEAQIEILKKLIQQ